MKKGCLIAILVFVVLVIVFLIGLNGAFEPQYEEAEIVQDIGGTLICNSTYNADHHSWQYNIDYKYKTPNDSIIDIGYGGYYGRNWEKDEQLIRYKDWYILKTGCFHGSDKLFIGKLDTTKWIDYFFISDIIEKDELWKSSNIKSLLNYCCAESFVEKIENGVVTVIYKFRVSESQTRKYDSRKIYYKIDEQTGHLKMYKIE